TKKVCEGVLLEAKLINFQRYFNGYRTHAGLDGRTPEPRPKDTRSLSLSSYRWQQHCRGLYQTPRRRENWRRRHKRSHRVRASLLLGGLGFRWPRFRRSLTAANLDIDNTFQTRTEIVGEFNLEFARHRSNQSSDGR